MYSPPWKAAGGPWVCRSAPARATRGRGSCVGVWQMISYPCAVWWVISERIWSKTNSGSPPQATVATIRHDCIGWSHSWDKYFKLRLLSPRYGTVKSLHDLYRDRKLPGNQRIRHRRKIPEIFNSQLRKTKKTEQNNWGYIPVQIWCKDSRGIL